MSIINAWKSGTSALIAIVMSATTVMPILTISPASAQLFPSQRNSNSTSRQPVARQVVIPSGTTIPVEYNEAEKILVTKEETVPLTVTIAANIVNRRGQVLIPFGSQIAGQIEPYQNGSRFVAKNLIINNQKQSLNAASKVVTRTEEVKKGASTASILKGAAIGAAAATVIAAITGDKAIATEEILGGAGLGALAGWLLGVKKAELISINPNQDLDLILNSDLALKPNN
jgi:hypothetical protein